MRWGQKKFSSLWRWAQGSEPSIPVQAPEQNHGNRSWRDFFEITAFQQCLPLNEAQWNCHKSAPSAGKNYASHRLFLVSWPTSLVFSMLGAVLLKSELRSGWRGGNGVFDAVLDPGGCLGRGGLCPGAGIILLPRSLLCQVHLVQHLDLTPQPLHLRSLRKPILSDFPRIVPPCCQKITNNCSKFHV